MTIGIGGQSMKKTLANLQDMSKDIEPITVAEFRQRLNRAQQLMKAKNIEALFITPGSNLIYFTGLNLMCTERLIGAILSVTGELIYIVPHFELDSFREHLLLEGNISTWQEHEDPVALVMKELNRQNLIKKNDQSIARNKAKIAICGSSSFTTVSKFINQYSKYSFICADEITIPCRQIKSSKEIAIIKTVMEMTLVVQQAAASILYEGISSEEVVEFINRAHKKVGATGSYFCLVLFAQASALPHGIKGWQTLATNDMVLIDTGCKLMGYTSDITRSYVYGEPTDHHREVWNAEKSAQAAAFSAAQVSNNCEYVDQQAREKLAEYGFSQGYELPGLPHRTGHGIGIDIHEEPYLVGGSKTALAPGMCFSNEPTICVPGEFGVRLEDHFYITEEGPKWFTQLSNSIDDPFGVAE
ncbi:MAG: Xaa-Pro dipeptidase [Paraglaciecola sp.]|jgi:Xaa-Pro dipeptidase